MKRGFQSKRILLVGFVALSGLIIGLTVAFRPLKAQEKFPSTKTFERFAAKDAITSIVRDGSKDFYRVKIDRLEDRVRAGEIGTIVEDYGSCNCRKKQRR